MGGNQKGTVPWVRNKESPGSLEAIAPLVSLLQEAELCAEVEL